MTMQKIQRKQRQAASKFPGRSRDKTRVKQVKEGEGEHWLIYLAFSLLLVPFPAGSGPVLKR